MPPPTASAARCRSARAGCAKASCSRWRGLPEMGRELETQPFEPFAAAAARIVRVRADELRAAADGVLDTDDIERVHDMRVATRRLRAVLEIFAPCWKGATR